MIDLTDQVIVLTGASSDTGGGVARQLVDAGATVILGYHRRIDVIERLMKELEPLAGMAYPYAVNVCSRLSVDAMVGDVMGRFGRIDSLIHGANAPFDRHPFLQRTWDDYEAPINVTLKGAFNCCQAVLEAMVLRREGRIVFLLNTLTERPVLGYSPHTAAVGALKGMARDLANEAGELGIRVNVVSPGFIVTDDTPHAPPHVQAALARHTPLRRLALPEDVARAVLFFMSDLSGFVTGTDMAVDGGYTFGYGGPEGA